MVYENYISEAKKLLSGASVANDALMSYYSNARLNINDNYKDGLKTLESQYLDEKNAAGAKSMLDSKNMDQFLASRGLARSGESVQSQISGNVSLNNTLSQLTKSNYSAINDLTKQKNNLLLNLEGSYANLMYDKEKWMNQLAFDIASAELAASQRKEDLERQDKLIADERIYNESVRLDTETRNDRLLIEKNAREDALLQEQRTYNEKLTAEQREYEELLRQAEIELEAEIRRQQQEYEKQILDEKRAYDEKLLAEKRDYESQQLADERSYNEKLLAEKREYEELLRQAEIELEAIIRKQTQADKERLIKEERDYEAKLLAEKREYDESQKSTKTSDGNGGTDANDEFKPTVSAKDMANNIVKSIAGDDGKISSVSKQVMVYKYLQDLKNQNIASSYLKDVLTNLISMGYKEPGETTVKAQTIMENSYSAYTNVKSQYYDFYLNVGFTQYESNNMAEEAAFNIRLDYIYKRCESPAMFTAACNAMGVTAGQRDAYYKRVASINSNSDLESIKLGMLL